MDIKPIHADVFIQDGQVVGTFTLKLDNDELALEFSMPVEQAKRARIEFFQPTFNVHKL